MESLLASHRTSLLSLFTTLSPEPDQLLQTDLIQLEISLKASLELQLSKAKSSVLAASTELDAKWQCVDSWRLALGEMNGEGRNSGCLLNLLKDVERIIESMRDRMRARGEAIISLQTRLEEFAVILGREWIKTKLDFVKGKGWEGLDLRLERMSELEREIVRCEGELVSNII